MANVFDILLNLKTIISV